MKIRDRTFRNEDVELDGNEYTNCSFSRCRMIFRGTAVPGFHSCGFDELLWKFEDAAARAAAFHLPLTVKARSTLPGWVSRLPPEFT